MTQDEHKEALAASRHALNQANTEAAKLYQQQKVLIRNAYANGLKAGEIARLVGHDVSHMILHGVDSASTASQPHRPSDRADEKLDRRIRQRRPQRSRNT